MTNTWKLGIAILCIALCCALSAFAQSAPDAYRLQPGDEITIQYRYTPEFNQTVTIPPDGVAALEIVGEVRLAGLGLREAREEIARLAARRLNNPEVLVTVKDFEKPYFIVAGEVPNPGKFALRERTTALQALMLAGGLKDQGRASRVLVFRRAGGTVAEVRTLDLKNALRRGGKVEDLFLQSGDAVLVPRNTISRVETYLKAANVGLFFNPLQWLF